MKSIFLLFTVSFLLISNFATAQTWVEQNSGASALTLSAASDDNFAWVSDGRYVYGTANGGTNWSMIYDFTNYNAGRKMVALDSSQILIARYDGGSNQSWIYKTTNRGVSWFQVLNVTSGIFSDLCMSTALTGYVVGASVTLSRFTVYRTVDGGWSWDSTGLYVASGGASNTGALMVLGSGIWFTDSNNLIHYSSNSGLTWQNQNINGSGTQSIYFNTSTYGLLAAGTQTWYTTNSGSTWIPTGQQLTQTNRGIIGNGSKFWIISQDKIYSTTNNGTNWVLEYVAPISYYNSISKSRAGNSAYATRLNGGVTKTGNLVSAVNPISSEIPDELQLGQNYPNPFNPTTKINFGLPKNSFVRIIIYDTPGRTIAELVNQDLNPGTYEVDWDASNYPSGIYYYRLTAGAHEETKKMVLVR